MPTQTASEGRQYKVEVYYHQRSTISGLIGFVHHVNDVRTTCDHVKYVDDCTIREAFSLSCADSSFQTPADDVVQWNTTNKMSLNYNKTKEMGICFKKTTPDIPPVSINERQIEQVNCTLTSPRRRHFTRSNVATPCC